MLMLGEVWRVSPLCMRALNFILSRDFLPAASIYLSRRDLSFCGEKLGTSVNGSLSVRFRLLRAGNSRNFSCGFLGIWMLISGLGGFRCSPAICTWIEFRLLIYASDGGRVLFGLRRRPSLLFCALPLGVSSIVPNPKLVAFYRLNSASASALGSPFFGGGLFVRSVFFIANG
jgi:hypothetical protein